MKLYKQIDLGTQLFLLIAGTICCFMVPSFIFYAYCLFGGWQLVSALVHLALQGKYYAAANRKYYLPIVAGIFFVALLFYLFPVLRIKTDLMIVCLMSLLLGSPIIGVWYIFMCNAEIQILKDKSLVHLK